MADAVEPPSPEFLLNTSNLPVLDATICDNDLINIHKDMHMVLEYEIQELLPPTPSIHNEIVGHFCNQEPGDLSQRSESAHKAYLASLTVINGHRVQINLNLGHIPRFLIWLSFLPDPR